MFHASRLILACDTCILSKIKSLHVIFACPCEQGKENIIALFIFQKVEPLAVPPFNPFRFLFAVTTKIGVL